MFMSESKKPFDEKSSILVNVMEDFVRRKVKATFEELGGCSCNQCFLDACALALNEIESKYVTTTKGALLSELTAMEVNNDVNTLVAVTKAVIQVMENPRHNKTP
jgi:competence protein ComFB